MFYTKLGDLFMYNAQTTKDRIRSRCKQQKISIDSLLKACNLGVNAISQINDSKGMASFSLARIADYLNCSVDYLLGRATSPSELSPEALELASRWDKLDDDGKALVRAELVHAERGKQHDQLE